MNGSIIVAGIALFFFISGLITFVDELHDDVGVKHEFGEQMDDVDAKYYSVDVLGDKILVLNGLKESKKHLVWERSAFKKEMLALVPNFDKMISFIEEKIVDDGQFKKEFLEQISSLKERYLSGEITEHSALSSLSNF